jgi:hypothetical protein
VVRFPSGVSTIFQSRNPRLNIPSVHVISKDSTAAGGNVPDSQITNQISVLNADYAASGVTWKLAGTTRTVNANWFNTVGPSGSAQTSMKTSLRKGGPETLNVYTVG